MMMYSSDLEVHLQLTPKIKIHVNTICNYSWVYYVVPQEYNIGQNQL